MKVWIIESASEFLSEGMSGRVSQWASDEMRKQSSEEADVWNYESEWENEEVCELMSESLTLSHTHWCLDVFVNPVITSVIYKFYPITKISRYNDNQQPLSYCQHGYYSHIYTTSVHTSVFILSLSKWSLTFKIGVPPRIDLILLVLICRVTPNNNKVVGTDT